MRCFVRMSGIFISPCFSPYIKPGTECIISIIHTYEEEERVKKKIQNLTETEGSFIFSYYQPESQVQHVTNNIPLLLRFISDKVYPLCSEQRIRIYGNIALFWNGVKAFCRKRYYVLQLHFRYIFELCGRGPRRIGGIKIRR